MKTDYKEAALIFNGELSFWESEGGFGPLELLIGDLAVANEVAHWLGIYEGTSRGGNVTQEGTIAGRQFRITVEEL